MSDIKIMKAVEFDKLSAAFKKKHTLDGLAAEGWWLQKKYDGCFGMAVVCFDRGESRMLSRTGEDYTTSCQHILDELHTLASEQSESFDFVVLGEVWHPGRDFPTISGQFRKRAASDLKFVANDLLPVGLETDTPYADRYSMLADLLCEPSPVQALTIALAQTKESGCWVGSPLEHAVTFKGMGGYDGAILRDPQAGYKIGLVKNGEIIKVKPVLSLDLRVVDRDTRVGERTGRPVYVLAVEYRGKVSWVGSGVPHSADALPCMGQIIEVEAMGMTDDGFLREPRFKGIRHDKEQPDT